MPRTEIEMSEPFSDDAFPSAKAFCRHMLRDGRLKIAPIRDAVWTPQGHCDVGGQVGLTCILFRSGCWQIELIVALPNARSPIHRHNYCESADVLLNGDLSGVINGAKIKKPRGNRLNLNITCLPRGAWHGGETETGLICLSFQRWVGMAPTFIANDWESYA